MITPTENNEYAKQLLLKMRILEPEKDYSYLDYNNILWKIDAQLNWIGKPATFTADKRAVWKEDVN